MSLYVYLNRQKLESFVLAFADCAPNKEFEFEGLKLRMDEDGRIYYVVKNERVAPALLIPSQLHDLVECVSWWVTLQNDSPTQGPGIYKFETAEAHVERNGVRLQAQVSGPSIMDAHRLITLLRTGRAPLVESWTEGTGLDLPRPLALERAPATDKLRFLCPACKASYKVDAAHVMGKTVKLKCRKCDYTITLTDGKVVTEVAPSPDVPPSTKKKPHDLN